MSASRQSNHCDDLPVALAVLAMSIDRHRVACVITDGRFYVTGAGESAELDAVSKFGTNLAKATVYVTRPSDSVVMKLLEKCGLCRLVILQKSPEGHNGGNGPLYVEYIGSSLYRVRDMVRSLEMEASI